MGTRKEPENLDNENLVVVSGGVNDMRAPIDLTVIADF